jgi:uncharacterized membrane protein
MKVNFVRLTALLLTLLLLSSGGNDVSLYADDGASMLPGTTDTLSYGVELSPASAADSGPPGGTVIYTLTLTNLGTVTDTFTLEATGGWAQLPQTTFVLESMASASVLVLVIIPAGAGVGEHNVALVTATSDGDPNQTAQSALTTTVIAAVYDVSLTAKDEELVGLPGMVVTFELEVKNDGNVPDSYELFVVGGAWPVTLSTNLTGVLNPGAWEDFTAMVTIPADALDGDVDTVQVYAKSVGDEDTWVALTLTTRVSIDYGVSLEPATAAATARPGAIHFYLLQLTNTGDVEDTFDLAVTGWATLPFSSITLEAGSSTFFFATVHIPTHAADGHNDVSIVTATSQNDENATATSILTTTVEWNRIFMPLIAKP